MGQIKSSVSELGPDRRRAVAQRRSRAAHVCPEGQGFRAFGSRSSQNFKNKSRTSGLHRTSRMFEREQTLKEFLRGSTGNQVKLISRVESCAMSGLAKGMHKAVAGPPGKRCPHQEGFMEETFKVGFEGGVGF